MKKFFLLICVLSSEISFSQNRVDSLLNELKNHPKEDTIRLSLLNKIAYEYSSADPDKGIATADEAIALAQKLNNQVKLAKAFDNKAWAYDSKENDSMALYFYDKALQLYELTGQKLQTGNVLHNTEIIYQRSNLLKALQLHQRALGVFTELNDPERIAVEYLTGGVDYNYLSNYPKALESLQKALKLFDSSGNKMKMGMVFANMGITYTYLSNFRKALEYHKKAIQLYEEINYENGLADEWGNIGNVYDDVDDSLMALQSYQKALGLYKKLNNKKGIGSTLSNIGSAYYYYKNYREAYQYLSAALSLYEGIKMKEGISNCLSWLANVYRDAPDSLLGYFGLKPNTRYLKVIQYQKSALALARETGSAMRQAQIWNALADTYEKQNDFRNAYYAFQKTVEFRDSAVNAGKNKEITQLEMRYEFNKTEDSIKAENEKKQLIAAATIKEEKTKKNFIVAGALVLIFASLIVFAFYKRRRDAEEKKHEAEFRTQVSDTELKALRAQMNPHFIFNSLNSINNYIAKNEPRLATEYLNKFAKIMRMTLENSEKKSIPLADELRSLELYMQLESRRLDDKFIYMIKIADDIDTENTLVPPMILQPFVENSIWHGIANKEGKGTILIDISKNSEMLHCIIDDDGVGRKKTEPTGTPKEHISLGMKITKARIDIINKTKNSEGNVELFDMAKGMRVKLNLPFELSF